MFIEIKSTSGESKITFNHFVKEDGEKPIFISLFATIQIDKAITKSRILVELSDISEMVGNLKILYTTLNRTFFFQHIDDRLTIKFTPEITGQVIISGNMRNENYSSNLEFKFESSQELMPELINQCEEVVKRFSEK